VWLNCVFWALQVITAKGLCILAVLRSRVVFIAVISCKLSISCFSVSTHRFGVDINFTFRNMWFFPVSDCRRAVNKPLSAVWSSSGLAECWHARTPPFNLLLPHCYGIFILCSGLQLAMVGRSAVSKRKHASHKLWVPWSGLFCRFKRQRFVAVI
jgi:hypothetical protein